MVLQLLAYDDDGVESMRFSSIIVFNFKNDFHNWEKSTPRPKHLNLEVFSLLAFLVSTSVHNQAVPVY